MVRFIYFTVCWACVLQFMSFNNSPYTFHAWNSVITIVFAISVIVYPIAAFILLYKRANLLTNATFLKVYDDLRVDQSRLFYFLFRYYKLLFIACIIGCLYAKSQYIAPCLLMVVNVVDAVLLLVYNPLNM